MVICQGHILDQDFSHNAHSWLAQVLMDGQRVKGFHNPVANLAVAETGFGVYQRIHTNCLPFFVERIRGALSLFIGPYPIETAHEEIPIHNGMDRIYQKARGKTEALIFLHTVGIDRDHRDVSAARLLQGSADKRHIVAGPAAAAGLGHHNGQMVPVILTG